MRLVSLLLAAGLGTRFDPSGRSLKLLQPTAAGPHAGLPIVQAAARSLAAAGFRCHAVVRPPTHPHQAELHALLSREGCELLICQQAAEGLGSSLACGVRATRNADGWIIALGDMPMIAPSTVLAIAEALRAGHATVAPVFRGQRGHPVGFAASCGPALMRLCGDRGARDLLDVQPPHLIEVDDAGILADIDDSEGKT